jgi:hypothetical protein
MGTFVMRWLSDGTVKLSKNAPKVLHKLVNDGHFKQEPRRKVRQMPKKFAQAEKSKSVEKRDRSMCNPYNVEVDQTWEHLDKRTAVAGIPRQVRVVNVGDTHAVVENMATGNRTTVRLAAFSGKGSKSYKRVDASTGLSLPEETPALVH